MKIRTRLRDALDDFLDGLTNLWWRIWRPGQLRRGVRRKVRRYYKRWQDTPGEPVSRSGIPPLPPICRECGPSGFTYTVKMAYAYIAVRCCYCGDLREYILRDGEWVEGASFQQWMEQEENARD